MWIGHASVLVRIDGITVLTDPVFGLRNAPLIVCGTKRYRDPPCTINGEFVSHLSITGCYGVNKLMATYI